MPTIAVTIVDQTVAVTQVGEIGPTGATGPTGTVSAAGDGTAGAPGIAFASDTNTGLFRPGTDILAASTGGTEHVRINASGNVGIGTTNPSSAKLQVESTFLSLYGATTDSVGNAGVLGNLSGVLGYLGYRTADGYYSFYGNSNGYFAGNVGIGTVSPNDKLEVVGLAKGIRLFTNTDSTLENGQLNRIDFYKHVTAGPIPTIRVYNNSVFAAQGYSGSDLRFAFCLPNADATLYDRVTFTSTGNVGIGTTSPVSKVQIADTVTDNSATDLLTLSSLGGNSADALVSDSIAFQDANNLTKARITFHHNAYYSKGTAISFSTIREAADGGSGTIAERLRIDKDGHVTPGADNTQNFGSGSLRWATIFAGTGTINTSDERYKVLREGGDLSDAEHRAWSAVRAIVYRDKDSFERKGDAARLHIGYSWQSIQAAFEAEGLDAARYGLWCEDALEAPVEKTRTATRPVEGQTETIPVLDDDGQPVFEQVQETEEIEQPFEEVRMIDGAPVLVKGVRTVAQPVFDSVQIRDEDGELIFDTPQPVEDPETGELVEGDPIPRMAPVPRMISRAKTETVPVMEEVEETYTEMEPTGETRGALRYSQCSVIEAAWLRRELASLTARVSALEAV